MSHVQLFFFVIGDDNSIGGQKGSDAVSSADAPLPLHYLIGIPAGTLFILLVIIAIIWLCIRYSIMLCVMWSVLVHTGINS